MVVKKEPGAKLRFLELISSMIF